MTTPEPDKAPATERPKAVTVGLVLWGLNALIYLGFGLLLVFAHGSLVDDAVKTNTKLTHDEALSAANSQLRIYEVLFVVFAVLAASSCYRLWTDRSSARIWLIAIAVAQLLVIFVFGSSFYTMVATMLGLIGLLPLYTPRVSAYFAALRQAA